MRRNFWRRMHLLRASDSSTEWRLWNALLMLKNKILLACRHVV